ncbi:DMT family transporter [Thalassospira australica]|uniref:DMT family transporter n=1 Tax=Thalassospira australica TaxID=1528106 RepID=UPI00051A8162|nr:DMT family transporter [Thalassospira australica]
MKTIAYFAFVLLGVIWGSNFIFMKWAAEYITPQQVAFLRVVFGFIPLLVFAVIRGEIRLRDMRHIHHFVVMALLATAIYYFAFAKGAALLLSSVAGMLSGAIPLFTFVTALLFLREERSTPKSLTGLALGFAGVVLIARPWQLDGAQMADGGVSLVGTAYMVAGALSVGCSFVYARKFITPLKLSAVSLSTYQIGIATLIFAVATDYTNIDLVFSDPKAAWGLVVGLGILGTGLAYILYYFIVAKLGAMAASGVTYLPPLVAMAVGGVLVGEPIAMLDVFAMIAILIGVFLQQTGKRIVPVSKKGV